MGVEIYDSILYFMNYLEIMPKKKKKNGYRIKTLEEALMGIV